MTKLINGGTIGLEDRKKHYEHALAVLTGKEVHQATPSTVSDVPTASGAVSRVLKVGSRGAQVKKLQEALSLEADGVFGNGTESALKTWQSANGLDADGVAGPSTLAKLLK